MQDFNALDIGILVIFALSTFVSIYRGFMRELITLIVWSLAFIFAYTHGSSLGSLFTFFSSDIIRQTAGSFVIFTGIILIGAIVKRQIIKSMGIKHPGGIDRTVGAFFGAARAAAVVVITLIVVDSPAVNESPLFKESKLLPDFEKTARFLDSGAEDSKWNKFKIKGDQSEDLPTIEELVPPEMLPPGTTDVLDQAVGGSIDGDGQPR